MNSDPFDLSRLSVAFPRCTADFAAEVCSTNDWARERAAAHPADQNLLLLADRQTAGRGRGENRWWTGAGSLAFSLLLDPRQWNVARRDAALTSLAVASAVAGALSPRLPNHAVGLHWPNDVFVDDRKICGVLVEGLTDGRLILGVGLNVNNTLSDAPPDVRRRAATLFDLTGEFHPRTDVLVDLLTHLSTALDVLGRNPGDLAAHCNRLCLQHGAALRIDAGREVVAGLCAGIADDGALLLETPTGLRRFHGGALLHEM